MLAVVAVMAPHLRLPAVEHQRHVALRAAPHLPARAAGEEVRPAPAVEQHDRLAPCSPQICERLRRLRVQPVALLAHVEQLHRRQRTAVHPAGKAHTLERMVALRPRRRAAQQQQRALQRGALGGDLAGVVAGVAFVLVGGVVLLVDDDQPQLLDRREHRRARAHAHARLARPQSPPLLPALSRGQARVQYRHRLSKAPHEAADDLWGECDLRHQHDRAPTASQRARRGAQVHLRLTRPGDSVQQQRRGLGSPPTRSPPTRGCRKPLLDRLQRLALVIGQWRWLAVQPSDRLMPRAGDRARTALAHADAGRALAGRAGGQHQPQRTRHRRAVLRRQPLRQCHQVHGYAELERTQWLQQLLISHLAALREARHDPQHLAPPERHHQHRADPDGTPLELRRQPIVERAAQRAGRGQGLNFGDLTRHPKEEGPGSRPSADCATL